MALYVIRRQDLASGNDKFASIVILSVPSGSGENIKDKLQKGRSEAPNVKVILSAPIGSEEDTKRTLGTTARVYPATAQVRVRSDSRENASPPSDVGTAQVRARQKGDDAVREGKKNAEKGKESKARVRYTAKERKAYGKLIHARTHYGHSSNI